MSAEAVPDGQDPDVGMVSSVVFIWLVCVSLSVWVIAVSDGVLQCYARTRKKVDWTQWPSQSPLSFNDSSTGFRGCHYQLTFLTSVTAGEEQKVGWGEDGRQIDHVVENEGEKREEESKGKKKGKGSDIHTHMRTLEADCYSTVDGWWRW